MKLRTLKKTNLEPATLSDGEEEVGCTSSDSSQLLNLLDLDNELRPAISKDPATSNLHRHTDLDSCQLQPVNYGEITLELLPLTAFGHLPNIASLQTRIIILLQVRWIPRLKSVTDKALQV